MKRALSLLFVFTLLLTCGLGETFAEVQINNQFKNGEGNPLVVGTTPRQEHGLELILSTGDQYVITMPNTYSYITPLSMYVDAPGDHSIYVYKDLDCDKEKLMPFAYEGMRVTAVAEQKNEKTNLTCIVYRDENYRLHAGWVHSRYLTVWFPGAVETIGSTYMGTMYTTEDPVISWGKDYFVNTKQKYTVLSTPIRACAQFQLNYQVTGRGGASTEEVLGPRTVFVNDGTGWTMVGQFDYSKIQSVLVTVNMPEPMDLLAVAVIPSCVKPELFSFRQGVQDALTANAAALPNGNSQNQGSGTAEIIWENTPNTAIINQPPTSSTLIINGQTSAPNSNQPPARAVRKGSIVTYGTYEQDNYRIGGKEPIEWIVLDVQDDRVLLISRYGLDCLSYCSRQETVAWETSRVRAWLNDQFLNVAFTSEEQSNILVTEVDNSKNQGYIHYDGDGGNNTQDQLFLLSYAEAWKYFYQSSDRACKPTKVAIKRGAFESEISGNCPWWLRSPGYTKDYVACVDVDGNRGGNLKYGTMAIRPAMWVYSSAIH